MISPQGSPHQPHTTQKRVSRRAARRPQERQAQYLLSSLEEAKSLPSQVNQMVSAWRRGDVAWFARQMREEFGRDPQLYQSLLAARNRKWISKIEALLNQDAAFIPLFHLNRIYVIKPYVQGIVHYPILGRTWLRYISILKHD